MAKSALAHRALSADSVYDRVMNKVFGDPGPVRNMDPQHSKAFDEATSLFMREPHVTEAASAMVRLLEAETSNLVSFSHSIVDESLWERPSHAVLVEGSEKPTSEVDLFVLIRHFVGHMTSTVFMGKAFVEFHPGLFEDLFTFDKYFNLLLIGIPRWIPLPGVSAAYAARHRLLRIMMIFHASFAAFEEGRDPGFDFRDLDDVSEQMKERMRCWRKAGFAPGASAPGDLMLFWAMNTNSPTIVFWNIMHIIADPELLSAIRQEIAPFVKAYRPGFEDTGLPFTEPPRLSIDLDGLLNSCPLLKATYFETLRLDTAPFSYREAKTGLTLTESDEDAATDGVSEPRTYSFYKGDYLAIPHGAQARDPRCFPEPDKFDPYRFICNDPSTGKQTAGLRNLRPFGGGSTICKGRVFAERQILAFTASIISMWDIELVDDKVFNVPRPELTSGAYVPKSGVKARLQHRV